MARKATKNAKARVKKSLATTDDVTQHLKASLGDEAYTYLDLRTTLHMPSAQEFQRLTAAHQRGLVLTHLEHFNNIVTPLLAGMKDQDA